MYHNPNPIKEVFIERKKQARKRKKTNKQAMLRGN
jgi:hypothetical protein